MTANQLKDLLVDWKVPCKFYVNDKKSRVTFRVDWRYRHCVAEWLSYVKRPGVKFVVSGTLMPWECKWPKIVEGVY